MKTDLYHIRKLYSQYFWEQYKQDRALANMYDLGYEDWYIAMHVRVPLRNRWTP